jgi:hypothetical protein
MVELSTFQTNARQRVEALFDEYAVPMEAYDELTAHMPHMKEPEVAIRIVYPYGEVWMYTDEATFSWKDDDVRLEREDFDSSEALLSSLVDGLSSRLRSERPAS